jgi:signal transduction histidine kinase
VISEAVTKARKHADATSIDVRAAAAKGVLRVEVIDDCRGGASETAGSGLQGLRDRVEAIGGSFAVDRADRDADPRRPAGPAGVGLSHAP